ncbi:MAG: ferric reductase-like transmembrane domain-containing protein [Actinomycetota bacterium]|nr:ferric reductase-like transmembrane domain-containing protein [Actinomycetota bacterium]
MATTRARIDAAVRLGAAIGLWGSLLLVSYWWATGGGFQALGSWTAGLTSTGRLTGLLASVLLLVQVLLMSRLPVLEHAFGQERLARIHRYVGFSSFNLMLAHIVLIAWGYAAGNVTSTPATLWGLIVDYPGMLLATAGTLCLVMVVFTSVKAARRKLRYESWHLLHLYAYLGVGLALPHQLWTGKDFLASTARTVFCWGLWAAAAAAVLTWRVALPLWRSARYGLRVSAVVPETGGLLSVYMTARRPNHLTAEAGQFFNFRFLNGRGWTRSHPYSLSATPDRGGLRITAKVVGDGSAALRTLRPGTRILTEGPYGRLSAPAPAHAAESRSSAPASASPHCAHWPRPCPTPRARPSCCTATPADHCSKGAQRAC